MNTQKPRKDSHITVRKDSLCLGHEAERQKARKMSDIRGNDVREVCKFSYSGHMEGKSAGP